MYFKSECAIIVNQTRAGLYLSKMKWYISVIVGNVNSHQIEMTFKMWSEKIVL